MNDIPNEESKFESTYLNINETVFKVKFKKGENKKDCIIWLPGRNDYFYHYHISEMLDKYDIYILIYRNCHEMKVDISDYFFDIKDVIDEINVLYTHFKINSYENVVLYGHSTGGLIATIYQNETVNKISKVVLNSPFYKYKLGTFDYYWFNYFMYYIIPIIPEFDLNKNTFKDNLYVNMLSEKFNIDTLYKKKYNVPVVSSWFRNITRYHSHITSNKVKLKYPTLMLYSDHSTNSKGSYKGDEVLDIKLNLDQVEHLGKCNLYLIKDACHDVLSSYYKYALDEAILRLTNFLES